MNAYMVGRLLRLFMEYPILPLIILMIILLFIGFFLYGIYSDDRKNK